MLLLACAPPPEDTATAAEVAPADEPGPWAVGARTTAFVNRTGTELPMEIWYPTLDAEGPKHAYDDAYPSTVAVDEPEPDCSATRPVMIFSHGSGGVRWQSPFLVERLASFGWVIAAPDHVGDTFFDEGSISLEEMVVRRPADVADTFDALVEVFPCADPTTYVVAGHSFGGFTAIAVAGAGLDPASSAAYCDTTGGWLCDEAASLSAANPDGLDFGDPRARAAIAMAPAGYEVLVGTLDGITIPGLFMGGDADTLTPVDTQVTPLFDDYGGAPRGLGVLAGAGHFLFSEACTFWPVYEDCDPPYLSQEDGQPLIQTAFVAWARHIDGEATEAWLWEDDPLWTWTQAP